MVHQGPDGSIVGPFHLGREETARYLAPGPVGHHTLAAEALAGAGIGAAAVGGVLVLIAHSAHGSNHRPMALRG